MTEVADLDWVPQACTLPRADRTARLAEFDEVFRASAGGGERLSPTRLRVTLTGGAGLADSVRELAGRESQCCPVFSFRIAEPPGGGVQLDIEVAAGHGDVLDALAARAAHVRSRP
jgi:hypothetical protein